MSLENVGETEAKVLLSDCWTNSLLVERPTVTK